MYIQFSKDINKIRNTFFWVFTVRESIIGGTFVITGFILYQIFKSHITFQSAGYLLFIYMLIPGFILLYNKNGLKCEKVLFYKIKRLINGKIRPYKTENLYAQIEKEIKKQEVKKIAVTYKNSKTENPVNKKTEKRITENSAAKHTVSGHEKRRYMHGNKRLLHKNNAV